MPCFFVVHVSSGYALAADSTAVVLLRFWLLYAVITGNLGRRLLGAGAMNRP